ncbi:MAG: HxlR family transcriptional regulator [Proteobacteria bacterium]|nr:HxlR family transcriptional regulator [Pseudomonadota bacterium]
MSNKEISQPNQNIYEAKCPIIYALDIIGQKWKIPIMWHLSEQESIRYNELKRSVTGITNMMLTKSLQELEAYQLVNRIQYDTIPPKVEYSLTERGKSLLPALNELHVWGEEQILLDQKAQQ